MILTPSDLPYRPISQAYQMRFGARVYKVPVSVADDCPNRKGLRGMETCSFCDVWGSAAHSESLSMKLADQIKLYRENIRRKFKAAKFLIYFQAYTTTFTKIQELREAFELAVNDDDVVGFVIGTRPDCLSKSVIDLWQEFHERKFVAVEVGVQSFNAFHLEFMRRGHTAEQSLKAIERIARETDVDLGIHLILGCPREPDSEIIRMAEICNSLPITNVKLHNLHVLKQTKLETWYRDGLFEPVELEEYSRRVEVLLQHLSPRIFVHRLAAYASRREELVAPEWVAHKMKSHQAIVQYLRSRGSYQSQRFQAESPLDQALQRDLAMKTGSGTSGLTAPLQTLSLSL
ncbi:MAG: TIGR01212 family radical SAM protein [Bdellovibrionaceae bacterium]|nr:TIGR01212 family radical SAM protein [Pseudobdellovibrionaceae bacterium]